MWVASLGLATVHGWLALDWQQSTLMTKRSLWAAELESSQQSTISSDGECCDSFETDSLEISHWGTLSKS